MDTPASCPGRCARAVFRPSYPCDWCWDRLPANLKRRLLLSAAGVDSSAAIAAVAAYFDAHPPSRASQCPR